MTNFWIWEYDNDEKKMLEDILQYFKAFEFESKK